MKRNNMGFSLVELMVVIAIMAVLVGLTSFSFGLVLSASAKECSQKLSAQMSETRIGSMSRFGEELNVYYHQNTGSGDDYTDGYYVKRISYTIQNKDIIKKKLLDNEIKKISTSRVTITAYLEGDSTPYKIDNSTSITIGYNHSSGAFQHAIINGVMQSTYFERIIIESGGKIYTIKLVPETGKHIME